MHSEYTKILESDRYRKSGKTPSIISAYLKSLIKRIGGCKYSSEKPSTTKVGVHISSDYSLFTIWTFDGIDNKHDVYRSEDCMKKFCESLREHVIKIINFEKKKMISLTNEQQELHEKTKICKKVRT